MTPLREDYRFYSKQCLRWAEETDNEEHRQAFLDMAVVWMKLAAAEKHWVLSTGTTCHKSDLTKAAA